MHEHIESVAADCDLNTGALLIADQRYNLPGGVDDFTRFKAHGVALG
jgi:hypothetical protein